MKWRFLGSLSEARKSGCSGVYLIVHQGVFDRVVYVGVSNNVGRRISEHYEGYLRGNRTIYNAGQNDDVYKYMSAYKIRNHTKHYQELANQHKIWASTTVDLNSAINLLSEEQQFGFQWEDILLNKYLPQLVVWALPFADYTYEKATLIESVIQTKLVKAFDLRGFFNLKQISILGKIEKPDLTKISQCIDSPKLDLASQVIFNNLHTAGVPIEVHRIFSVQLDKEISQREKEKEARFALRQKKILRHKNYGKPWTHEDQEKLRVMLVDFEMKPSQMASYLGRDPRSIAKRISNNDKLSQGKWRQDLKWL
ncbi:GIY-YIG nuclease family protein [Vibrio parahaemolyticus]|nr:GIY-YIG nuclease family protein [Vibrio parahaemolyticus]MDF4466913.1 GIY-YIG nuclease family protein [Vibrio parahaemolyticus]MDF4471653.1 GIY-YIG nuclease family protein [Vibrio parahaemolyticus]MDF4494857.1 GIY-YIG nuclease family protein [Vibrio parahaemolyticus]MDG2570442.1 GIY-YIG nuclease family protein [Vibrio parahaemolyticus]